MHQQHEPGYLDDPRITAAVEDLTRLIVIRYPNAQVDVSEGEDPYGVYLIVTVDIDDPDEVTDLVIDRTMALQIEQQLPIYVVPIRPISRVMDSRRQRMEAGVRLPSVL